MKTINVQNLTNDNFKEFGVFSNMVEPTGYSLNGEQHNFYRDTICYANNTSLPTAFSTLRVKKPDRFVVSNMEYHNYASEIMMALDADFLICLCPANSNTLLEDETVAFIIPKGTMIYLKTAVWHSLPMSIKEPVSNLLIVLPERVYHNDLNLKDYMNGGVEIIL